MVSLLGAGHIPLFTGFRFSNIITGPVFGGQVTTFFISAVFRPDTRFDRSLFREFTQLICWVTCILIVLKYYTINQ